MENNLSLGLDAWEGTSIEKSFTDNDLEKGGGEGSRGGKIIGHTKSGKPIYDTHNHSSHSNFTSKDHYDARMKHLDIAMDYDKKGISEEDKKHHSDQNWEHDKLERKTKKAEDKASKVKPLNPRTRR